MSAHNRKTPACGAFRRPAIQLVNEPRSLCARRRKENPTIFFGDMCGEENTSQAASVEFVRAADCHPFVKKDSFLTV